MSDVKRTACRWLLPSLAAALGLHGASAQQPHVVADRFVPHVSTAPANAGDAVGLFLRERLSRVTLAAIEAGEQPTVVLFVHGGSVPSVPDYDLPFSDYSWMEMLAEVGFDTFALDHTGYGRSPRPLMDDPCNVQQPDQALLIPDVLASACESDHATWLTTVASDVDEIDTVVDYLRELRGVERVHLIGWSRGGRRSAAYAATYPDKVDRLILFAPSIPDADAEESPPTAPMRLQTKTTLMQDRWLDGVVCENQVAPGIQDVIWQTIMAYDSLGSVWQPPEGVMRVRVASNLEWDTSVPGRIAADTLILVGQQDGLLAPSRQFYADLALPERKVLVEMECATHMAVWERTQYRFMHEASRQWLLHGELQGQTAGRFSTPAFSLEIR